MFGKIGYVPNNPQWSGLTPPVHHSNKAFSTNRGDYKFYESTINWVYGNAQQRTFVEDENTGERIAIDQSKVTAYVGSGATIYVEWQCQGCQKWFRYEALQIDHKTKIGDFWADVQPGDWADGSTSYNDVNNLRLLCSTCNTCHCWE